MCPLCTQHPLSFPFAFPRAGHAPRTGDAPAMLVWHSHIQVWPQAGSQGGCSTAKNVSGDAWVVFPPDEK